MIAEDQANAVLSLLQADSIEATIGGEAVRINVSATEAGGPLAIGGANDAPATITATIPLATFGGLIQPNVTQAKFLGRLWRANSVSTELAHLSVGFETIDEAT